MSDNSYTTNDQCIEMWRSAIPNRSQRTNSQETALRPPSALSDSDYVCPPSALSDADAPPPSALSNSDDMRPPSALSNSDAPPPSALSDDDFRLPSPLSSDVGSISLAVSGMNIASAEHQGTWHSRQDDGYFAGEPCSRASFSSTLAENGSAFCLAYERTVQWVIEREQVQNNRVQRVIDAAESSVDRLRRLVANYCSAGRQEEEYGSSDSITRDRGAPLFALGHVGVSFAVGAHPEHRNPIRAGTPGVLPITVEDYYGDDEKESEAPRRRKTQRSERPSRPSPPWSTPELLQSPVYVMRALAPSEVWDEQAPAEPILHAPVPMRPLREPELLLAGYSYTTEGGKELE